MSEEIPHVVVTLPVHNEVQLLEGAIEVTEKEISKLTDSYIILIAEDGSRDGTKEKAIALAESDPRVICLHSDCRLGRGRTLTHTWMIVEGDIFLYLDSDLATDMSSLPELVRGVEKGYDIVVGSRYLPRSEVRRPMLRCFFSKAYNWLVRRLFYTGIRDHQCGFKAFSRRSIHQILPLCRSEHWFWDTEFIVLARKGGLRMLEVPVRWEEKRRRKTSMRRLIGDVLILSHGILTLWSRLMRMRIE